MVSHRQGWALCTLQAQQNCHQFKPIHQHSPVSLNTNSHPPVPSTPTPTQTPVTLCTRTHPHTCTLPHQHPLKHLYPSTPTPTQTPLPLHTHSNTCTLPHQHPPTHLYPSTPTPTQTCTTTQTHLDHHTNTNPHRESSLHFRGWRASFLGIAMYTCALTCTDTVILSVKQSGYICDFQTYSCPSCSVQNVPVNKRLKAIAIA